MTDRLAIAIAQLNPTVGDLDGNAEKILAAWETGARLGADLVVTPELSLCGYPPEDLVLKRAFRRACADALDRIRERLAGHGAGPALAVGLPLEGAGGAIHNASVVLDRGDAIGRAIKRDLPNYGVFDEKRIFTPGDVVRPIPVRGVPVGLMICEDMWFPHVAADLRAAGAELLIAVNGSPFEIEKHAEREQVVRRRTGETGLALAFVNQVGGQDELVFDGASFVANPGGEVALRLPAFEEQVALGHWERAHGCGPFICRGAEGTAWEEGEPAIHRVAD